MMDYTTFSTHRKRKDIIYVWLMLYYAIKTNLIINKILEIISSSSCKLFKIVAYLSNLISMFSDLKKIMKIFVTSFFLSFYLIENYLLWVIFSQWNVKLFHFILTLFFSCQVFLHLINEIFVYLYFIDYHKILLCLKIKINWLFIIKISIINNVTFIRLFNLSHQSRSNWLQRKQNWKRCHLLHCRSVNQR